MVRGYAVYIEEIRYLECFSKGPIPVNSDDLTSHMSLIWDNMLLLMVF